MPIYWDRLNWQEYRDLVPEKIDTVILPVGTIEAHGVTNLATDIVIPAKIAEKIADSINAMIAPPVFYGVTRTLYPYPGSLTVRPETFEAYMTELLCSMAEQGMKRIVVMNGHGGNNDQLKNAAFSTGRKFKTKLAVIHWWMMYPDLVKEIYQTEGGHAAVDETAMVLAADETLVKKELYDEKTTYLYREGAYVYPIPGTVITYKEGTGRLDFDIEKARTYLDKICDKIKDFLLDTFEMWERGEKD
jgi:creatinine amidohydrolase